MEHQGVLAVVSGFSGAGKGTLMKELVRRYDNYALSVSATTRDPRQGEVHGREYFFLTDEQFEEMIREGKLIEYARYVDHYYGTPREYVTEQMQAGRDVILEIDIQGARRIREQFPEALLLFVTAPSAGELRSRLVGRGTESPEVIEARLARARREAEGIDSYDYLLINDDLDECVEQAHRLIQAQHLRVENNRKLIENIRTELDRIQGGGEIPGTF